MNFMHECEGGLRLAEGGCAPSCPEGWLPEGEGKCSRCHYSCRACVGPNDYHCSLCYGDAVLVAHDQESYCYPHSLMSAVNVGKWYVRACVGLALNICLLASFALYLYCQGRGFSLRRPAVAVSYSKDPAKLPLAQSPAYNLVRVESDSD